MKYAKRIVSGILTVAVIMCSPVLAVISRAAQQVCIGNTLGTFNGSPACMSGDNLHICAYNFPDENFRACIINYLQGNDPWWEQKIDTNGDGLLTESEAVSLEYIRCDSQGIADLGGVEFFTNIWFLSCYGNLLTELDISKNTKLYSLYCGENRLLELDITNNLDLWNLDCYGNLLVELDVGKHPDLYTLNCSNNQLSTLTLDNLPSLGWLSCNYNQLTEVDISQCPELESLRCVGNRLTDIDVSNNPWIYHLDCDDNKLTTLNVDDGFYDISCANNQIEYLDLSHCTWMDYFNCIGNPLIELKLPEKIPSSDAMVLAYGTCSYDTDWRFDEHNKLTIYGSGNMDDYPINEYVPETPYYDIREGIQSVCVEENVTHIGGRAFYNCGNVKTVRFQGNAPTFADNAFGGDGNNYVTASVYYPAGNETWTSDNTKDYGGDLTWIPYYEVMEGANSVLKLDEGETLTIRAAGAFDKFQGVSVDGIAVDPSNYTAAEGSTVVTFAKDYLKTLRNGEHMITLQFEDGISETALTITSGGVIEYGDATGDGKVDGFDVIRLKKYLANYDYDTETSAVDILPEADANGDGNVDGFDVIRLKKYLANYDYEAGKSTIVLGPQ